MEKKLQIKIPVLLCIVLIGGTLTFAVPHEALTTATNDSVLFVNQSQHSEQSIKNFKLFLFCGFVLKYL